MTIRQRKPYKAIAVFLVFALAQIYVQLSFAAPASSSPSTVFPQNIIVARLVTTNNQPITVNGATAATGATILTGATIQTPADIGATINLGALGTIDLAPNTTIRLEFDENGKIKVTLINGCVIVKASKKTEAEVATEQNGTAAKKEKGAAGPIDACFPPGASAPTVGQGAAAAAGAGAGASSAAAAGATAGGLTTATIVAIVLGGAGAALIPLGFRGTNPSPSSL